MLVTYHCTVYGNTRPEIEEAARNACAHFFGHQSRFVIETLEISPKFEQPYHLTPSSPPRQNGYQGQVTATPG